MTITHQWSRFRRSNLKAPEQWLFMLPSVRKKGTWANCADDLQIASHFGGDVTVLSLILIEERILVTHGARCAETAASAAFL